MYEYYNANSLGNFVNDCTIRSISLAEGHSWDYTYNKMSNLAQKQGTMMDDRDFIQSYLDSHYERVPYLPYIVGDVAKEYPNNILLITMKGHIVCAKYGKIFDSFDCTDRISEEAWIVY